MENRIVSIDLDARSYDIYIGEGLAYRLADVVPEDMQGRSVFIVTDKNVETFAGAVSGVLAGIAGRVATHVLAPGEHTKSFEQAQEICRWLLDNGISRNSVIFAVGGGVVGDLAGFCASVVLRGVPYVQIPTTLLAQVDSSVGGKTGINTAQGKNLVGSFYQPSSVIADIETLKTLPRRELLAGYAEIVKYALIQDPVFFNWLEESGEKVCALDKSALMHAIETSVRAKAAIVQSDERETGGLRALLNFGHTFGHALETAARYDGRLLHGEAVAIGMCMAMDLSYRMGLCTLDDSRRVEENLTAVGLPIRAAFIEPALKASPDSLIETMKRDKKAADGAMRFVVSGGIGQASIRDDVPEKLVREVLQASLGAVAGDAPPRRTSAFSSVS